MVARMARIGLKPGSDFTPDTSITGEIDAGAKAGLEKIRESAKSVARVDNGWMGIANCGRYGTNYLSRAVVALNGLGCSLPEDTYYPTTMVDAQGERLTGANAYVIQFPAGQTPPVRAFWSITVYDESNFLVENAIDRSAISSWMPLKKNANGSTTIYVQRESPGGDKESNWLPAPDGEFNLMLRMYWPASTVISGAWRPPPVTRAR
jgi:hypothetical protein